MRAAAVRSSKPNESRAAANAVFQRKNDPKDASGFADNQPAPAAERRVSFSREPRRSSPFIGFNTPSLLSVSPGRARRATAPAQLKKQPLPIQLKGAIEIFTEAAKLYDLSLAEMDLVLSYGKEGIVTQLAAIQYDEDGDWGAYVKNQEIYKKMDTGSLLSLAVKKIKTGNCGQTAKSLYGALLKGNPGDIDVAAMEGKQEGYEKLLDALIEKKEMIFKIDVGKSHTFFISKEEDGSIQLMQAWQGMYTLADWLQKSGKGQTRYTLEEFVEKILGVSTGEKEAEKSMFKPEQIDVNPKIEEGEKVVFIAGVIDSKNQEINLHKAMQERFKEFR